MGVIGKDGRYELHTQIGQGTRAAVYAAVDLRRRLPVVVRRFDKAIATHSLARHAEVAAAIGRAGIALAVMPYEVVVTLDSAPFAVFTAIDGDTLESQLHDDALQWVCAVEIVASCAETVAAVQAATGEIHGALKPSNVGLDLRLLCGARPGDRPLPPRTAQPPDSRRPSSDSCDTSPPHSGKVKKYAAGRCSTR